jgi:ADP-heptose:LPS heptosyltransferase/predicted SAM-dependent methyltransferase
MTWSIDGPMGNESGKIKWEIAKWTRGRGLDLGCGIQKTYPHFIGVDNRKDAMLFNHPINPDVVVDTAAQLPMFASGSMDFVFSSHLLEHFPVSHEEPRMYANLLHWQIAERMRRETHTAVDALKEWLRVLKKDGYLVLYVPDEDEYPKVGTEGANPDHCFNVNYDTVIDLMKRTGGAWDLVDFQKRAEGVEYSLFFVFRKVGSGHHFSTLKKKPKPKTAGLVRYGAFGDLLQCSSVAAGLKAQGYEVTLYTSPPGHEVILHDPNIDHFYLQDKDQVPNHLLGEFWKYHAAKYDKWVNLSESVECTFLSVPGKTPHTWPPAARHALMNHNYLEMQHRIAGVPHVPRVRFFPTPEERAWAQKERQRLGGGPLILWALAGSSVHKTWAGLDASLASILLDFPQAQIVLVGGPDARLLEQGWECEPRVHRRSGVWSIRQTMAFLETIDVAIGPETGVMNAVSDTPVEKVVLLSHSTHENLTRDWVNTAAIASVNTTCPGRGSNEAPACHMMHYTWEFCRQHENGTAQCQADIDGAAAYGLIQAAIRRTLARKVQVA